MEANKNNQLSTDYQYANTDHPNTDDSIIMIKSVMNILDNPDKLLTNGQLRKLLRDLLQNNKINQIVSSEDYDENN